LINSRKTAKVETWKAVNPGKKREHDTRIGGNIMSNEKLFPGLECLPFCFDEHPIQCRDAFLFSGNYFCKWPLQNGSISQKVRNAHKNMEALFNGRKNG
jgi:hypothetical protein